MITLLLIIFILALFAIMLLILSGTLVVSFGWLIFIVLDVAFAVWLIIKIIRKIANK